MQGVADHKNVLGNQRFSANKIINKQNEASAGSLFSFKTQMLGNSLLPHKCHQS